MQVKTPKDIMFISNGNTVVFDQFGKQMQKFQGSWIRVYTERLLKADPTINLENLRISLPNGKFAKIFKTDNKDWNLKIEKS